jgi:acetolactate synthase-1/2/3 large subunit
MKLSGNALVARALANRKVDTIFFLMGGPMNDASNACIAQGIRLVDVRHEQAAAMMAQAYARIRARPGVCTAASGPGAINLTTGLANALVDCAPVVALGGSSPIRQWDTGAFQEIDQLAIMRPVTKWAQRVHETERIPEYIDMAFRRAMSGKPGPVYLDLPGDVLYREVDDDKVRWPQQQPEKTSRGPLAPQEDIERIVAALRGASRPVVLSGSGVIYSRAAQALQAFVERTGIPFYTTPQGRGVIPEDHACFYANARSQAFQQADFVLVVGTRLNYVVSHLRPPRFAADAVVARIDIDPAEVDCSERADIGIVGDAGAVLDQINRALEGRVRRELYAPWRETLATIHRERRQASEDRLATDQVPIHPLRLCKEVRDFIDRDAILVVDGQEILKPVDHLEIGRQVADDGEHADADPDHADERRDGEDRVAEHPHRDQRLRRARLDEAEQGR